MRVVLSLRRQANNTLKEIIMEGSRTNVTCVILADIGQTI